MKTIFTIALLLFTILYQSNALAENDELSLIKPDVSGWKTSANAPSLQAKYHFRPTSSSEDKIVLRIWLRNVLQIPIARLVVSPDFGFKITKADANGNIVSWHNSGPETSVRIATIQPGDIHPYNLYLREKDLDFFRTGQLTISLTLADRTTGSYQTISYPLSNLPAN